MSRFGDGADGVVAFGVEAKREVFGALPCEKHKEPMAAEVVVRDRELVHGGDLCVAWVSCSCLVEIGFCEPELAHNTRNGREHGGVSGNFPGRIGIIQPSWTSAIQDDFDARALVPSSRLNSRCAGASFSGARRSSDLSFGYVGDESMSKCNACVVSICGTGASIYRDPREGQNGGF